MDFKERLKQEYLELKDKHDNLIKFFQKDGFQGVADKVGAAHAYLLREQESVMMKYLEIL